MVADQIHKLASRHYLLSYCSPSCAGSHELEVEAILKEDSGKSAYDFDAEGFEPDCDPNDKPAFDVAVANSKKRRPLRKKQARNEAVSAP